MDAPDAFGWRSRNARRMVAFAMEKFLARALGQDVSQLATEEKQQLLSRLLARLAHEIRNPLSSLEIHAQLLGEDVALIHEPATREPLASRLQIIRGELRRLETIVQQFLRLAGPSAVETSEVRLENLVAQVVELLRPEAAAREVELSLKAAPLPTIQADPVQLSQALMNLVINALQAVDRGGRVEIQARPALAMPFVLVEVHDSGPGVPADMAGTIFEPYFTTKSEGSGLGLWIAQQIAMAHGGAISVTNHPAGGAVFTLRLPLATSSDGQVKNSNPRGG